MASGWRTDLSQLPLAAAVCVCGGGGFQTELSMTHGLVRRLPAIQHNGLCTQWPRCLSCWNAKHASNGFRCCVLCCLAKVRPPPTGLRRHANFPPPWSGIVKMARRGQVLILEPGLFFSSFQVLHPGELNTAE